MDPSWPRHGDAPAASDRARGGDGQPVPGMHPAAEPTALHRTAADRRSPYPASDPGRDDRVVDRLVPPRRRPRAPSL